MQLKDNNLNEMVEEEKEMLLYSNMMYREQQNYNIVTKYKPLEHKAYIRQR